MNNEKVKIIKIPLRSLIEVLLEIYNTGIDYADMFVEKGEHQDSILFVGHDFPEEEEKKVDVGSVDFDLLG
jgi:hypothetical protein